MDQRQGTKRLEILLKILGKSVMFLQFALKLCKHHKELFCAAFHLHDIHNRKEAERKGGMSSRKGERKGGKEKGGRKGKTDSEK